MEHAGSILSRCQKGRDGRTPFERLHGKKPTKEFVPFGEKAAARPIYFIRTVEQNELFGVRNNSAECFVVTAEGVFRAREVRRVRTARNRVHRSSIRQRDRPTVENRGPQVECGKADDTN